MIKIAVITTAYKRPLILDLFLKNFISVKRDIKEWCDLQLFIAGDEEINYGKVEGCTFIRFENKPLGKKWNSLLDFTKGFDYNFVTGSDDIFNAQLFESYKPYIYSGYDYLGLLDSYYYYIYYADCIRYSEGYKGARQGEPDGGGRLIHKSIIEKLRYKLWDDEIDSGLDWSMTKRIKPFITKSKFLNGKERGAYFIDIKSDVNITHFNDIKVDPIPTDEATKILKSFSIYEDIMNVHEIYKSQ